MAKSEMLRWILSIAIIVTFAVTWKKISERLQVWLTPVIVVVMVSGVYYLISLFWR